MWTCALCCVRRLLEDRALALLAVGKVLGENPFLGVAWRLGSLVQHGASS